MKSPTDRGEDETRGASGSRGTGETRDDTDNRGLFQPATRYTLGFRRAQRLECAYVVVLLVVSLISLAAVGLGLFDRLLSAWNVLPATILTARRYELISA